MSRAEPGGVRAPLPGKPPQDPEPFEAVFRDLERIIVPGLSHWQHPDFFGYFPSNGELSSVLGDYLSTGLGVLGLSWQSSPALTELEEVVTDWVRQMVGLPETFSGVIQDTASTSTLVALLCARERTTGYSLATKRPAGGYGAPRVSMDVAGDRGGRLAGLEPAQMARRGLRLLGLPHSRSPAPRARDEHQPELPPVQRRRAREEPARLGRSAGAAVPRAETLVPH